MANPRIRFGRKARGFNPSIPHMSALTLGFAKAAPKLPASLDNTSKFPKDFNFGPMLNDQLGDCTCAAFYHARQIWRAGATSQLATDPDSDVLQLYEKAAGYDPSATNPQTGINPTDNGAQEQVILQYLYKTGAPVGDGTSLDRILAYVEVDPRNVNDVKRTIYDCGVSYIGFVVPTSWTNGQIGTTWDVVPGDTPSNEGHAVILTGYDHDNFNVISWGRRYTMTKAFLQTYVDESYAIADNSWVEATGKTPLGMSASQLVQVMQGL